MRLCTSHAKNKSESFCTFLSSWQFNEIFTSQALEKERNKISHWKVKRISTTEQSTDMQNLSKKRKWQASQQDWTISCLNTWKYLKKKISTNGVSVHKEYIQKESHKTNPGSAYLWLSKRKGAFGCQHVLSTWDRRPPWAWVWMHGAKNQWIEKISGPMNSMVLILKCMH